MTKEVGSHDEEDGRDGEVARPDAGADPGDGSPGKGGGPTGDEDGAAGESPLVELARFSGHGLTIAVATGLFLMAGWWVDGRLGTTPLLTIVGALVGAGAGFYSMLQHLVFFPRERERVRGEAERDDGEPDEGREPGDSAPDPKPEGPTRGSSDDRSP